MGWLARYTSFPKTPFQSVVRPPGDGGDVTVASLPLPAGSWFVTATAEVNKHTQEIARGLTAGLTQGGTPSG